MSGLDGYELLDRSSRHGVEQKGDDINEEERDFAEDSTSLLASCLNFATFAWVNDVIRISQEQVLDEENVPRLPQQCLASYNRRLLEKEWSRDSSCEGGHSLTTSLWQIYGWRYAFIGVYLLLSTLALFIGPVLLKQLVEQAELGVDTIDEQTYVMQLVGFLFLSKILASFFSTQYSYQCGVLGVCVGAAIRGSLFGKIMLLSTESRRKYAAGSITNLYTTDISRITDFVLQLHRFWALPLQIVVAMALLYACVGVACFAGVLAIMSILLLNHAISTFIKKATDKVQKCKDRRMEHVSSWLMSSLVMKLNCWEEETKERIFAAREEELTHVWTVLLISAVNICLLWLAPCIVSVSTIASYATINDEITAARIFTAVSLFKSLQDPFRDLPGIITQYFQAMSSIERLDGFMKAVEAESHGTSLTIEDISNLKQPIPLAPQIKIQQDAQQLPRISILRDIKLMWSSKAEHDYDDAKFVLELKKMQFETAELVVVRGQTGAGKSSFLHALMGSMYPSSYRDIIVTGTVAYAGQQAFVINGTIRHNITLGRPFDQMRFNKVLTACCLHDDLKRFALGAEEVIGERGVGLSGGQKARVALARAVYADAAILLLDDVFAALDSKVSRKVFDMVVLKLLKGKTRLIVTHNNDILHHPSINKRVSAVRGAITVETLAPVDTTEVIQSIDDIELFEGAHFSSHDNIEQDISPSLESTEIDASATPTTSLIRKNHSYKHLQDPEVVEIDNIEIESIERHKEDRATGEINQEVYTGYIKEMGGLWTIVFLCGIQIWWQILSVGADVFLSRWTAEDNSAQQENLRYNIALYSVLSIGSGLTVFIRTYTISAGGYAACKSLFDRMVISLMYAPMAWLDNNPVGRILNRFSDDMSKIDLNLPFAVGSCFACLFSLAGTFVAVAVITRWLIFAAIPVGYIYLKIMRTYLRASREVQRMQQVAQSPFLSFISEVLNGGIPVIRALELEARFLAWNDSKVNKYSKMQFLVQGCSSWFTIRVQCVGALILLLICTLALSSNFVGPSATGLVISYGLSISDELQFAVMIISWFENSMICPERVEQYCSIPPEGTEEEKARYRVPELSSHSALMLKHQNIPNTWSIRKGDLEFSGVFFRYQVTDKNYVLSNVSFRIEAGSKVGIVGRTGSGKSSLAMALFRVAELSGGRVCIDGMDVSAVDLGRLRAAIEIIPQNPVILKGTLRTNLDPFQVYTDLEIMHVVKKCRLHLVLSVENLTQQNYIPEVIKDGDESLCRLIHTEIEDGGENLSVGQRQVIILARAVLRGAKILVCDEATANIDERTENHIQELINTEFSKSTMIVIAHRLKTILSCDEIIVMDAGQVAESGSPEELLATEGSLFSKLAAEHG